MSRLPLPQFIRESLEDLVDEWAKHAASCVPAADDMDVKELRNHSRQMLVWVADDMDAPQSAHEQRKKSMGHQPKTDLHESAAEVHAVLRVGSGFTLEQVVGEFRALRATVLRRRAATVPSVTQVDLDEMTRFNESIDQLLSESVARYTAIVKDAFREADRNKDRFLATLSHELRNPVNAISLGVATLRNGHGSGGPDLTMMLARQTRHLKRLLDDLLDLSRIKNDRINLNMECVDIRTCISDALAAVQELITRKNQAVSLDMPGEAVPVRADSTRITQIVANLLTNAAKFSPMQSTIKIGLRRCPETVELWVRDNGPGIAEERLGTLFEPFGSSSRDNAYGDQQGLGLGLWIGKRLAELHSGTLTARSAGFGAGAEFRLVIPALCL